MTSKTLEPSIGLTWTYGKTDTFSCIFDKIPPCSKKDCEKGCVCYKTNFATFPLPPIPTKDSPIVFSFNKGIIQLSGSQTTLITNWKPMELLGVQPENTVKESFADKKGGFIFSYFNFTSSQFKDNRLRVIVRPTCISLLSVKKIAYANDLSSSSFVNTTAVSKEFTVKVAGETIQDIDLGQTEVYNNPKFTDILNQLLLPTTPVRVVVDTDGNDHNKIDTTFTIANFEKFQSIFYTMDVQKLVGAKQKGVAKLTADYYEYDFILGYQAIIVGQFMLTKSKCEQVNDKDLFKLINIKDVKGYKEYINFSLKATLITPGKVTGEYYSINPAQEKPEKNDFQQLKVTKLVEKDECEYNPPVMKKD